MKKLHLGCGGTYLEGYINIDYPVTDKTIMNVKADVYQDITTLEYENDSIDEIRSHHVFEHFNRVDALRLLVQWRKWLKPGGTLVIETPDYFWCSMFMIVAPFKFKMELGRHVFGTQEDYWANHLDFWYRRKFKKVLKNLGFEAFSFTHPVYRHLLPCIKVVCRKSEEGIDETKKMEEILQWYILKNENAETYLHNWLKK